LQFAPAPDQYNSASATRHAVYRAGAGTVTAGEQHGELDAYFAEARGWDLDRIEQSRRDARIAWRLAGAAAVCSIAVSIALVLLMPLKRVEPFVVRVDSSSGVIDVVPVYAGRTAMDETVTRFLLSHYVTVCERFNYSTAESDYEECGAFHNAKRNQAWYALWNQSNPRSPLNIHKDGSIVEAQVTAVSFFQRANGVSDTAQVRYLKSERVAAGAPERLSHWTATIQYSYGAPSGDPKVRRWNPLGFKVLDLTSELEASVSLEEARP
jgi:type IV secretion system protein VirB8